MKKFLYLFGFLLITGLAGQASALTVQNASFESDLTGSAWNSSGSAVINTEIYDANGTSYTPQDLAYFAQLAGKDAEISQELTWLSGETISFYWSYLSFDGFETNDDFAFFEIGDDSGSIETITISADGADSTGWIIYTYTFASDSESGSYISFGVDSELEYESFNTAPILLVDNITTTTVPEPASLLLLGSGLLSIAGIIRRKRSLG